MKAKDYKGIEDYIEKKKEEKKDLLKGTVICKAKKCNKYLYKNQSTSNPEYCMECLQSSCLISSRYNIYLIVLEICVGI